MNINAAAQSSNQEIHMKRIHYFLSLVAVAFALASPIANAEDHSHHVAVSASESAALAAGEILKVDRELARITIKHGPLTSLKMPAMTMAFKVKDVAMLDQVKPGDKVSFSVEKLNGAPTITVLKSAI